MLALRSLCLSLCRSSASPTRSAKSVKLRRTATSPQKPTSPSLGRSASTQTPKKPLQEKSRLKVRLTITIRSRPPAGLQSKVPTIGHPAVPWLWRYIRTPGILAEMCLLPSIAACNIVMNVVWGRPLGSSGSSTYCRPLDIGQRGAVPSGTGPCQAEGSIREGSAAHYRLRQPRPEVLPLTAGPAPFPEVYHYVLYHS